MSTSLRHIDGQSIIHDMNLSRLITSPVSVSRRISGVRLFHNTTGRRSSAPASAIANQFLSRFQSIGPQTRTQILDANQLQLFSLTLRRNNVFPGYPLLSNAGPPAAGTPIPPGYHLIYFTPAFLESELGIDGSDASYNPGAPFTRRMWAGGEIQWKRRQDGKGLNLLRVGQEVRETTRLLSAESKVIKKTGDEMIVVGLEKVFENQDGVAVVDRRNWVFREALKIPDPAASSQTQQAHSPTSSLDPKPSSQPLTKSTVGNVHKRTLSQSPVTLFRFSALTFNSHKIHYSLPWAQQVEGHRGLVVHGPLNLISILNLWRDVMAEKGGGDPELIVPESISYRATNPVYAEEDYQIVLEEEDQKAKANIYDPNGTVCMKADIAE